MLTGIDRFVIGACIVVVVVTAVLPVAFEAPMFARCTQAALDMLASVDPLDRHPPMSVMSAVEHELPSVDLPLVATRMTMRNSRCNGPAHRSLERSFETLGLGLWWHFRFSREDLVALYISQAYLGYRPMGFSTASRAYFGRDLSMLTPDEARCLARKARAPNVRDYTCSGK